MADHGVSDEVNVGARDLDELPLSPWSPGPGEEPLFPRPVDFLCLRKACFGDDDKSRENLTSMNRSARPLVLIGSGCRHGTLSKRYPQIIVLFAHSASGCGQEGFELVIGHAHPSQEVFQLSLIYEVEHQWQQFHESSNELGRVNPCFFVVAHVYCSTTNSV